MHRRLSRNVLRAVTTAAAAGLLALAAPAPGQAADAAPALELTNDLDGESLVVEPYGDELLGKATVQASNTGSQELKDFTVTVDATALRNQMEVTMAGPDQLACVEKQPLLFTCDGKKLNGGKPLEASGDMSAPTVYFRALATARPGFTGEVRAFAEAGGAQLGETTFKTAVKDIGLVVDRGGRGSPPVETKPGATLRPPVGFTHYSQRPLKGVYIGMTLSQGLSYTEEFSNCEYGVWSDYGPGARCYIETPIEPGHAYDLDQSPLKVGATALHESWDLDVYETAKGTEYLNLTDVHRGTGRELKLVPRAAGPGKLVDGGAGGRFTVANDMDYAAVGATVDGKAGQVVKAELGIRNNGPATIQNWMGSEPGEAGTSWISVKIPAGTTAVKVPSACATPEGPHGVPGAKSYGCIQGLDDYYFDAGQLTPFVFELRIDDPAALAPGSITVSRPLEDDNTKNNTAPITVTVDGKTGGGSGSPSGNPGSGSASGGAAGSTTTGSGTSAPTAGSPQGSIAETGAGALPWYAAAAAVTLAAGVALFTIVHRRKRHAETI
ncbi:hypothetical protein OKJ48_39350 [Streptomyces kunmingensis]|uniref:Peptidase n=1 Tax=Streptomyces kunmingensis TaxID=68225 RepID=A0ABU6CQB2_9ACTN|nr:hypothetical protein [Streptomyces kunmingensis]MEB3966242.1 hypothetical protein [Streptomyces kunmingensis]